MGYGIFFIMPDGRRVGRFYLTYNFNSMCDKCIDKYNKDQEHVKCERQLYFRELFSVRDMQEKTAKEVADKTNSVLDTMKSQGHNPRIPPGADGWTVHKDVFMFHMKTLNELAKSVDQASKFYSDCFSLPDEPAVELKDVNYKYPPGIFGMQKTESGFPETYYRHPVHGTVTVKTFAMCTDIAFRMQIEDDPRYLSWQMLALAMPDAPRSDLTETAT